MKKLNLEQNKRSNKEVEPSLVRLDDIREDRPEKRQEDFRKIKAPRNAVIMNEQKDSTEESSDKKSDDEFMMGIF